MTPNNQEFVDLCRELRALGALSVETEGRKATFTPTLPKVATQASIIPSSDPLERYPRK